MDSYNVKIVCMQRKSGVLNEWYQPGYYGGWVFSDEPQVDSGPDNTPDTKNAGRIRKFIG
jgi:hypothetical protein